MAHPSSYDSLRNLRCTIIIHGLHHDMAQRWIFYRA